MAQWNKQTQSYLPNGTSIFETVNLADKFGAQSDWRPSFTSKNRLRVSNPHTVFHHTFSHTLVGDPTWLEEKTGTAESYIANNAANPAAFDPFNPGADSIIENTAVLHVIAANDSIRRETATIIPYVPGKEQFVTMACRFDLPEVGITRRIGMYDANNGFYFEDDGTGDYFLVVKKNGVETVRVGRNAGEWNGDTLEGDGRSQITANPLAQQLLGVEYEWYGTGSIRFGYVIDGEFHVIHTVNNANNTIGTWIKTPFLPLSAELIASPTYAGSGAYFYLSSTSVISEGEYEEVGQVHTVINKLDYTSSAPAVEIDSTGNNIGAANTFFPILTMRLKDVAKQSAVKLRGIQAATTDNTTVFLLIVRNATLTGATFADQGELYSAVEVDEDATDMSFTKDDIIYSATILSGTSVPVLFDRDVGYQLKRKFTTNSFASVESETITIAMASTLGNKTGIASLSWSELL